eukprot:5593741-Amphidinium_carterae.1
MERTYQALHQGNARLHGRGRLSMAWLEASCSQLPPGDSFPGTPRHRQVVGNQLQSILHECLLWDT